MQTKFLTLSAALVSLALIEPAFAAAADADPGAKGYPGVVALSPASNGGFVYRQFPSLVNLYVRDGDRPGRSTCNNDDGCFSAWPPLVANEGDKPVGDWSIITRDDGLKQWAFNGKPVYRRFHDLPEGNRDTAPEKEGFHLLKP